MANDNAMMAELAKNLWNNYMKDRVMEALTDSVSFYRATVVTNNNDGTLTIQRPYDNQFSVKRTEGLADISAGDQVVVLRFGNGNNNSNHLAFAHGDGTLGLEPEITYPVPISLGGTNATTALTAKSNLRAVGYASNYDGSVIGSASNPVYVTYNSANDGHFAVPCTHTLEADVPSNAVFTDTTDLTQMTGTLPISNGGTGASTELSARIGLSVAGIESSLAGASVGSLTKPIYAYLAGNGGFFLRECTHTLGASILTGSIASSGTLTITAESNAHYVLITSGTGAARKSMSIIYRNATNTTVSITSILTGSEITIAGSGASDGVVTVTNSNASYVAPWCIIVMSGSVTTS